MPLKDHQRELVDPSTLPTEADSMDHAKDHQRQLVDRSTLPTIRVSPMQVVYFIHLSLLGWVEYATNCRWWSLGMINETD